MPVNTVWEHGLGAEPPRRWYRPAVSWPSDCRAPGPAAWERRERRSHGRHRRTPPPLLYPPAMGMGEDINGPL